MYISLHTCFIPCCCSGYLCCQTSRGGRLCGISCEQRLDNPLPSTLGTTTWMDSLMRWLFSATPVASKWGNLFLTLHISVGEVICAHVLCSSWRGNRGTRRSKFTLLGAQLLVHADIVVVCMLQVIDCDLKSACSIAGITGISIEYWSVLLDWTDRRDL